MNTTRSDSAMTAEDIAEELRGLAREQQRYVAVTIDRKTVLSCADLIEALSTERTKLTADLARVEGERDAALELAQGTVNEAYEQSRNADLFVANAAIGLEARALAAEAKSARLAEALRSAKAALKQFERHEKLLFEITGDEEFDKSQLAIRDLLRDEINRITVALTLPEPSHEP